MSPSSARWNEAERLAAVARYSVTGAPPAAALDELAEWAAELCGTACAAIHLIDDAWQRCIAAFNRPVQDAPRAGSLSERALQVIELLEIPDLAHEPGGPPPDGMRFYAGAVLHTPDGLPLGTLCVLDRQPRRLSVAQRRHLTRLARQVVHHLESCRLRHALAQAEHAQRTEDALRQAQKMEAIGQLSGGLAHDFNNLLTGVLGALDLIERRIGRRHDPALDRYVDAAVTSANRAVALTHRLLAFARRQSLDPQPVDVDHLVRSMADMLQRTLGGSIRLDIDLQTDICLAHTDAHQLENALLNLVINARDAMPEGGRLGIETRCAQIGPDRSGGLAPGDYVLLSVQDTGIGMPPEVVDKVFDPFFTTKPIGQGTGLGLSMVYGFVKQAGGHVHVESRPGRGSRITLFLPRHLAASPPTNTPSGLGEVQQVRQGETVLVVEDEAAVRMLVTEVLRELGYSPLEAADADSALPYLAGDTRIDLLVTDVGLPGMNGRQLADIARQRRPGLKVLFITGYAPNAEVRSEFLAEGMDMLAKPFNIDLLGLRIRQMVEDAA